MANEVVEEEKTEKLIALKFSYFIGIYFTELLCIHPLLSAYHEIRTLCVHSAQCTLHRRRACSQLYPCSVFKLPGCLYRLHLLDFFYFFLPFPVILSSVYFVRALAKRMQLVRCDCEDAEDFDLISSGVLI